MPSNTAASSMSNFLQNEVTKDDILQATTKPRTLANNDDWRLDMQKVNKDGTLNLAVQANKNAETPAVREIAKGRNTTVSHISWGHNAQPSPASRLSQSDHLRSEAAFALAALEMKYSNPIKSGEKTEAQERMEAGSKWVGNHLMEG